MKKLLLTAALLACTATASAVSVETTASFRNMMKREYNITVPKTLTAGAKAAQICYGVDAAPCNKLDDLCQKSKDAGCKAYNRKLQALAAEEYDS